MASTAKAPDVPPMRVAFNAAPLLSTLTGVGFYTKELAQAMSALGGADLTYFYAAGWSKEIRTTPLRSLTPIKQLVKKLAPHPYAVSRALQQVRFSTGVHEYRFNIYHEPNYLPFRFDGPVVITVHDLSWIRYPETHPIERVKAMERYFPKAVEKADRLIAVSEFTRRELIDVFGVAPSRITTTLEAARDAFRPRTEQECAPTLAENKLGFRRFLLCVGTLEPRKNLEFVITAYAGMPEAFRRAYPLVLVGMRGWLTSRLEATLQPLVRSGEARPLGYVSDEALAALYSSALALVYPSVYEGFGLPPLEAMACGTPAIVSNRASLPEVVGDAGDLVEPDDVDGLRAAILRLSGDRRYCEERSAACIIRASEFSWSRCAHETVAVYRQVLRSA